MWALIGEGANDVQIPCLIWIDQEKALLQCKEIFNEDPYRFTEDNGKIKFRWMIDEYDDDNQQEIFEKMYISYSGGCGDCYAATLLEIEEGKPFAIWNLD